MYIVYGIKKSRIDSDNGNINVTCCYSIISDIISSLRGDTFYCNYCKCNPYWQKKPKPQCQHYYSQQREGKRLGLGGGNEWEQIYCQILDTYIYRKLNIITDADPNSVGIKKSRNNDYIFRWDAPFEVSISLSLSSPSLSLPCRFVTLLALVLRVYCTMSLTRRRLTILKSPSIYSMLVYINYHCTILNVLTLTTTTTVLSDSSGFIGEEELKFWLEALGIRAPKRKVLRLIN